jgi:hypothetical protein
VALGNGPWAPPGASGAWAVVVHGLALLRAAVLGHEAPPDPPPTVAEPPAVEPQPGPAATDLPADLAPLVGTYAAFNPWVPEVRVRPDAAGTGLVLFLPGDDGAPLVPRADGGFRIGDDPASPERVEFTAVVEGRPTRAVVSGWPFDRVGP